MKLNLTIDSGNEAVTRGGIAVILEDLAYCIESGSDSGSLRDINGNRVGQWELDEEIY